MSLRRARCPSSLGLTVPRRTSTCDRRWASPLDEQGARDVALEERACQHAWVWGWCRGEDRRFACYLEERQAINWMRDRLSQGPSLRLAPTAAVYGAAGAAGAKVFTGTGVGGGGGGPAFL
jgi:hypothetical protein